MEGGIINGGIEELFRVYFMLNFSMDLHVFKVGFCGNGIAFFCGLFLESLFSRHRSKLSRKKMEYLIDPLNRSFSATKKKICCNKFQENSIKKIDKNFYWVTNKKKKEFPSIDTASFNKKTITAQKKTGRRRKGT